LEQLSHVAISPIPDRSNTIKSGKKAEKKIAKKSSSEIYYTRYKNFEIRKTSFVPISVIKSPKISLGWEAN